MKRKYAKMLGVVAGCLFSLVISNTEVYAQEETGTAGASLGKEIEEISDVSFLAEKKETGWIQDEKGWYYRYSDGSSPKTAWRKIDGKWYYFDKYGYWIDNNEHEVGTIKGIDVSKWQGNIDWQAVKEDGIEFAFIRLGYGKDTIDKTYVRNMQEANRVGIPVGVYYYSTALNEAEAIIDAQTVIKNLKGYKVSYPVAIDLEEPSQEKLGKEKLRKIVKAFSDEIRSAGYTPMLYTNENWCKNYIDVNQLPDVEKWIAAYRGKHSDTERGIWQCCSTGRVAGIAGNVDINFAYKDYTELVVPRTEAVDTYAPSIGKWMEDTNGRWYQYIQGGYPVNKWEFIQGKWYYFNGKGYVQTGWQKIGNTWYYLDETGVMTTGWKEVNGVKYYFNESGAMATGWKKIDNIWYYLNGSGAMATGWLKLGNIWYYLNENGAMATGWKQVQGTWYYFNESGSMQTGWQKIGNTWYYLNGNGSMATGWLKLGNTWYYLNGNGSMATGWLKLGNTWYYLNGNGSMATGWLKLGNTWYYLNGNGSMATGWLKLGNTWYYLNGNGSMATGWLKLGNTWYYLNGSGAMQTGWHWIHGSCYYFYGNGAMAADTYINGWYVNSSGAWVA